MKEVCTYLSLSLDGAAVPHVININVEENTDELL